MTNNEKPFLITKSIWFTIITFVVLVTTLFALSSGRSQPPDPVLFYLFMGGLVIVLGANNVGFSDLFQVMSVKEPQEGFNLLIGIFGIGYGGLVYSTITYRALQIFSSSPTALSVFKPFYLPLSIPEQSITLGITGAYIIISNAYVGFFEEVLKIFWYKNIVNWLHDKGYTVKQVAVVAFVMAQVLWASMHYFAWQELTLISIFFASMFGGFFWLSYFIVDYVGILTPKKAVEWGGVLITGAITSHVTWDILAVTGLPINYWSFVSLCMVLCLGSLFGMAYIKQSENTVKIEDMRTSV